jgi:hydroxymethylpyrimidine pyrophosphatase-like HAD family hydrolase
VRRHGVAVLLVTGRRLADLRQVCPDLTCFDVVVGENGAVLEFPASGRHVLLTHPPPPAVVDRLRQAGISLASGEAIVEMHASAASTALATIRSLELPLTLIFNRDRLMLLPPAVSKSTGLRQALTALRLSIHNAIGIGDAENDHDLLDSCEVGAAVSWGSPALRAVADEIIEGTGPPAVAQYLRRVIAQPRLSSGQMGRRRLALGIEHDGTPVSLAIRGRPVVIAGDPGTGKSWLAGLICEQLILQGYGVCIIDPEGDYRSLAQLPGVILFGGNEPQPDPRELIRVLRHPDLSLLLDLSHYQHRQKTEYLRTLLPMIGTMRRRTGLPHRVLVDEAHYYIDASDGPNAAPDLGGYVLVTYRVSLLAPAITATTDAVVIVTREGDAGETATLTRLCQPPLPVGESHRAFSGLGLNEAALLPGPEESQGRLRRFRLGRRLTSHVRHRSKYLDAPVSDERSFVFTRGGEPGQRARTLKEFMGLLVTLPADVVEGHVRRHDVSRWLADVFREPGVAATLRTIESRLGVDTIDDIAADLAHAIRARYESAAEVAA